MMLLVTKHKSRNQFVQILGENLCLKNWHAISVYFQLKFVLEFNLLKQDSRIPYLPAAFFAPSHFDEETF